MSRSPNKGARFWLCYPPACFKSNKGASFWLFLWGLGVSNMEERREMRRHEKKKVTWDIGVQLPDANGGKVKRTLFDGSSMSSSHAFCFIKMKFDPMTYNRIHRYLT